MSILTFLSNFRLKMADISVADFLVHLDGFFAKEAQISSTKIASELGIDHQKAVGLVKSLLAAGDYIQTTDRSESTLELLPEGVEMAKNGSHEFVFWSNLPAEGGLTQVKFSQKPKIRHLG